MRLVKTGIPLLCNKTMKRRNDIKPTVSIEPLILTLREQKVILDSDLAFLYGVPTKRLNEQVKRNLTRFPADFVFQLTPDEKAEVVANCDHPHRLRLPLEANHRQQELVIMEKPTPYAVKRKSQ